MKKAGMKYITILLFLIGGVSIANAQSGQKHQRMNVDQKIAKMDEQLNLTDIQKEELKQFFEEQKEKRKSLREQQKEERMSSMKEMKNESERRLQEILTPEQYTKLQELKAKKMAERRERRGNIDERVKKMD